jgi:hypothetical protein
VKATLTLSGREAGSQPDPVPDGELSLPPVAAPAGAVNGTVTLSTMLAADDGFASSFP